MKKETKVLSATGGAIGFCGLSVGLALCCTAPWIVTLVGVSGAVFFARLGFLEPFLLIGTVALLGLAFWFAYRPAPAGQTYDIGTQRRLRWVVWIATAVVFSFGLIVYATAFLR